MKINNLLKDNYNYFIIMFLQYNLKLLLTKCLVIKIINTLTGNNKPSRSKLHIEFSPYLNHKSGLELSTKLDNFEVHPQYDNSSLAYDICVIKTKTDLQLDNNSRNTVCLPENTQHLLTDSWSDSGESKCFIAGWGKKPNEEFSSVLISAEGKVSF